MERKGFETQCLPLLEYSAERGEERGREGKRGGERGRGTHNEVSCTV